MILRLSLSSVMYFFASFGWPFVGATCPLFGRMCRFLQRDQLRTSMASRNALPISMNESTNSMMAMPGTMAK